MNAHTHPIATGPLGPRAARFRREQGLARPGHPRPRADPGADRDLCALEPHRKQIDAVLDSLRADGRILARKAWHWGKRSIFFRLNPDRPSSMTGGGEP